MCAQNYTFNLRPTTLNCFEGGGVRMYLKYQFCKRIQAVFFPSILQKLLWTCFCMVQFWFWWCQIHKLCMTNCTRPAIGHCDLWWDPNGSHTIPISWQTWSQDHCPAWDYWCQTQVTTVRASRLSTQQNNCQIWLTSLCPESECWSGLDYTSLTSEWVMPHSTLGLELPELVKNSFTSGNMCGQMLCSDQN